MHHHTTGQLPDHLFHLSHGRRKCLYATLTWTTSNNVTNKVYSLTQLVHPNESCLGPAQHSNRCDTRHKLFLSASSPLRLRQVNGWYRVQSFHSKHMKRRI